MNVAHALAILRQEPGEGGEEHRDFRGQSGNMLLCCGKAGCLPMGCRQRPVSKGSATHRDTMLLKLATPSFNLASFSRLLLPRPGSLP